MTTQIQNNGFRWLVMLGLPLWFALALAASLAGVFHTTQGPPIALGLAAGAPVLLFLAAYAGSGAWRAFVNGASAAALAGLHTARLVGVVFLILYYRGTLPAAFAQSAGWGDVAVAVTAPLIALMVARRPASIGGPIFIGWNVLGMLDLVNAVTLGVLSSPSSSGGPTTEVMGMFPLSLIPTFAVPLLLIVHVILLGKAAKARESAPRLGVAATV